MPKTETTEFPAGAIHNGREFMRRIESANIGEYQFVGDMEYWDELKACFEHMAAYIEEHHAEQSTNDHE